MAVFDDPEISITGRPQKKASKLRIAFSTHHFEAKTEQDDQVYGNAVGTIMMGMTPSDWEFRQDDEWFITCNVSKEHFGRIKSLVEGGKMTTMRLVMGMNTLYTRLLSPIPPADFG